MTHGAGADQNYNLSRRTPSPFYRPDSTRSQSPHQDLGMYRRLQPSSNVLASGVLRKNSQVASKGPQIQGTLAQNSVQQQIATKEQAKAILRKQPASQQRCSTARIQPSSSMQGSR